MRSWLVVVALLVPGSAAALDPFTSVAAGWAVGGGGGNAPHAALAVGLLADVSDRASLGPRLRVHVLRESHDGSLGGGGSFMGVGRLALSQRSWVGAALGFGVVGACIAGDFCGGGGPAAGLELGVSSALGESLRGELALDVTAQTGMVNGVGVLLLPALSLGLRY